MHRSPPVPRHARLRPFAAVVEDDAQAGPDHVDSHCSVMLAISPWSRGGTMHRFVNTTDVLATAEEMLGLAPLSQFDRFGHPLTEWRDAPDQRPYDAIKPTQSIVEVNKARGVGALESRHIDFADADKVDDAQFNRILWTALKPGVAFPAPRHATMLDLARERWEEQDRRTGGPMDRWTDGPMDRWTN